MGDDAPSLPRRLSSAPGGEPNNAITNPLHGDHWVDCIPTTEHVSFFRDTDWGSTLMGELKGWGYALRLYVCMLMADSRAACIYWGPDKVAIYNEGFVPLAAKAHPTLMGKPFKDGFPEIWPGIKMLFDGAEKEGVAKVVEDSLMFVQRNGFLEETYFTGNFNPLRGDDGLIAGFYNSLHERTRDNVAERRRVMLNLMEHPVVKPKNLTGRSKFIDHVMPALEQNTNDVPMALLYKLDRESQPGVSSLYLKGRIGVPDDHPFASEIVDLDGSDHIQPFLRLAQLEPYQWDVDEKFDGIDWKGFGDPCKIVTTIPILRGDTPYGFLVLAANPRRPLDSDHVHFIRDLSTKLCSVYARVLTAKEMRMEREQLEKQLEIKNSRSAFLAEQSPLGMSHILKDGLMIWANNAYYELTNHPGEDEPQYKLSFIKTFLEEDQARALEAWNTVLRDEKAVTVDLRLNEEFTPPSGDSEPAIVDVRFVPVIEDGKLSYVHMFTSDVSEARWANNFEARKAIEAEAAKRKTEEMVDFISHELRNPLSAIFQLADAIQTSRPTNSLIADLASSAEFTADPELRASAERRSTELRTHAELSDAVIELNEAIAQNIDNARTILHCAQHQKRIVDDALTLSKIENLMLTVSPAPVQLAAMVQTWVEIFKPMLSSAGIKLTVQASPFIKAFGVNWILCDELRLKQIFINLMTNAIKFTKSQMKKEIMVEYGALWSDPRLAFAKDTNWAPNQRDYQDSTLEEAWGSGRQLFLTFAVADTGIGMTDDEIEKLFGKFMQASARTTIKYGGTGLGLFFSQRLTERLAGEIGVASTPGEGSTFVFYVKSRQAVDNDQRPELRTTILSNPDLSLTKSPNTNSKPLLPPRAKSHAFESRDRASASPPSVPHVKGIHVLVVEDNEVNQKLVQKQLQKAGCIVHVANHGEEALSIIRESDLWHQNVTHAMLGANHSPKSPHIKHIDIILMDWEMPVMNGLDCSREIRKLQAEGKVVRHVEILATTANAREEQIEVALESGIDAVIAKPFMVPDLIVRMVERLGVRRD